MSALLQCCRGCRLLRGTPSAAMLLPVLLICCVLLGPAGGSFSSTATSPVAVTLQCCHDRRLLRGTPSVAKLLPVLLICCVLLGPASGSFSSSAARDTVGRHAAASATDLLCAAGSGWRQLLLLQWSELSDRAGGERMHGSRLGGLQPMLGPVLPNHDARLASAQATGDNPVTTSTPTLDDYGSPAPCLL